MIYRTAPFSMTLNDPYPGFQGNAILWRWISQKRCEMQTWFQWNTDGDWGLTYAVLHSVISNDLEWTWVT